MNIETVDTVSFTFAFLPFYYIKVLDRDSDLYRIGRSQISKSNDSDLKKRYRDIGLSRLSDWPIGLFDETVLYKHRLKLVGFVLLNSNLKLEAVPDRQC